MSIKHRQKPRGRRFRLARTAGAAVWIATQAGAPVAAQPLSAIDWLSDSIREPVTLPPVPEDGVTDSAAIGKITVTPLDAPGLDAVGLLPNAVTGFPRDLWGTSTVEDLSRRIVKIDARPSPALQDLLYTLLLAELDPPVGAEPDNALFLARIDKLLEMGALDQAKALLERAGPDTSALFRRWFDVSLLTGTENAACDALREKADIAPTFQTRIFCLARNGDWNAAALTLETAKALGFLTAEDDALLARFLDPLLFEGLPPLPLPAHPTPLVFNMYEAIGQPIATRTQPVAFAHSDLRPVSGWKAQIEAAERLARSGAIDENLLLGIYTERLPAASGGIWDRVAALQRFDVALRARNTNAIAQTLPPAWAMMREAGLETAFARLYGAQLAGFQLEGEPARIAYRLGLLSPDYETIARAHTAGDSREAFLSAVAAGTPGTPPAGSLRAAAVAEGFAAEAPPARYMEMLQDGRIGEAILGAAHDFANAFEGDPSDASGAIALLRAVGLEDTARRAALEFLLAEGAA